MAIIDTAMFGFIFILVLVYLTYTIVAFVGALRHGWLAVVALIIFDAFAGVLLVGVIILNPLLTPLALIHFSLFVAPLNLLVVFGLIARYYLKRFCRDPYCYYPKGEYGAEKRKCRPLKKTGKYLPHEIDRISMKPYCRYIGMEFKPADLQQHGKTSSGETI